MALNPAVLLSLEASGLSNAALEQLLVLLDAHENGSITWHFGQGKLLKFELRQYGSLQNTREILHAVRRLKS